MEEKKKTEEYSLDRLYELIEGNDVISFDVFDTLVMRTVYYNKDVFRIVAENYKEIDHFYEARIAAERELTESEYPFIEKIYSAVSEKTGISKVLAGEIADFEILTEKSVIVPRLKMTELFHHCKTLGKKVYIISDMYLHKAQLEEILYKSGVYGYDKLFVSCEYNTSKPQNLFDRFLDEVKAKRYLHIGDNTECDIDPALKRGMNAFRVKTAAELWELSGGEISPDLETRNRIGALIAGKYNAPF